MFQKAFASIDGDITQACDDGADLSLISAVTLLNNLVIVAMSDIRYVEGKPFFSTLTRQYYPTYAEAAKAGLRSSSRIFWVQPDGTADVY